MFIATVLICAPLAAFFALAGRWTKLEEKLPEFMPKRGLYPLAAAAPALAFLVTTWEQVGWCAVSYLLLLGGYSLGHGSYYRPLARVTGSYDYKPDNEMIGKLFKRLCPWPDGAAQYNLFMGQIRGIALGAGGCLLYPMVGLSCLWILGAGMLWPWVCYAEEKIGVPLFKQEPINCGLMGASILPAYLL